MNTEDKREILRLLEQLEIRKARKKLIDFTLYTYKTPTVIYKPGLMHYLIADACDRVMNGEIRRLLISTPPRHGKSELVSRRLPALYLGRFPEREVISATYNDVLATEMGRDVRNIVTSKQYQALFPDIQIASDKGAKADWGLAGHRGSYLGAGVGTSATGRGADLFNVDDPFKDRVEAESEVIRKSKWDWFRAVALTRLMPPVPEIGYGGGAVIVTQTRWHEEDTIGMICQSEQEPGAPKWAKLVLPAIEPVGVELCPDYPFPFPDGISRIRQTEALDPRFPIELLREIEKEQGPYNWASLYQQAPRPDGGAFFDERNLLDILGRPFELPKHCLCVFATQDTALKDGKEHDGLGTMYWAYDARIGVPAPNLWLLDWDYRLLAGSDIEKFITHECIVQCNEWAHKCGALLGSGGIFVEDKGAGTVAIQQMQNKNIAVFPVNTELVMLGKSGRAWNASPYVTRKQVAVTKHAYEKITSFKGVYKNHAMSQILNFRPGTKETAADDLLDTFTYGISLSLGNYAGF